MKAINEERLRTAIMAAACAATSGALWVAAQYFPPVDGTETHYGQYSIAAGAMMCLIGTLRRRDYWGAVPLIFLCAFLLLRLWTTGDFVKYALPSTFLAAAFLQMYFKFPAALSAEKDTDHSVT